VSIKIINLFVGDGETLLFFLVTCIWKLYSQSGLIYPNT